MKSEAELYDAVHAILEDVARFAVSGIPFAGDPNDVPTQRILALFREAS